MTPIFPAGFTAPTQLSGKPEGTPILVAYSGGADSTALLYMLSLYGAAHSAPIYAAHVNHGIRGEEADRDEEFCRRFADSLGITLFVKRADVPAIAKESGESIETAARRVRYEFFDGLMRDNSIPLLATAHNANDNLETMLFNLVRGSGPAGICGIPPSRLCEYGSVIRPILYMTRSEILSFCEKNGLEFVTDSTNTDTDYTRNKLRAEVIPRLTEINPAAAEHAASLSRALRADELCLTSMADWFLGDMRRGYSIECEKLSGSPEAIVSRALISLFREISDGEYLESSHVRALRELAKRAIPHSSLSLPAGIEAVIEDGMLTFRKKTEKVTTQAYCVPLCEGENVISQTNCKIIITSSQNTKKVYKNSILLSIDSAKINGSLYARERRAGDKLRTAGMHKSVKKLMCDKKIPLDLRSRLPVICDGDDIVAVPMLGVCDRVKVRDTTKCEKTLELALSYTQDNH